MGLRIGILDLMVIYLLPILFLLLFSFLFLLFQFILVVFPTSDFNFKHDLLATFEEQKNLKRYKKRKYNFLKFYLKAMLGDSGTQAIFLYRLSRVFLLHRMETVADLIHRISKFLTGSDISPHAAIGKGFKIYHGIGIVIGRGTIIGEQCLVCQGATTGHGRPRIGNRVKLWAGAKVMGHITVGDDCEIGANSVLTRSIPANSLALGVPATRIPKWGKSTAK
jgi:serine O-acetyltransferase